MAEDIERIADLSSGCGPAGIRGMFSGADVYVDWLMFALVVDGVVYFKADEATIKDFERQGRAPFQYRSRDGKRTLASYCECPTGSITSRRNSPAPRAAMPKSEETKV